jgi:predicted ATPase
MRAPYYRELPLDVLDASAVDDLLQSLVGDDASTAALRRLIRERTGGNPFFVEEVVQSLTEQGVLAGTPPAFSLTRAVEDITVPPNVHALLAARVDRLSEAERLVLQLAAVIGQHFASTVLCHALTHELANTVDGLAEETVRQCLTTLEGADFIRRPTDRPDTEFVFKHPLTRAVAYDSHLTETRGRRHLAVARALQSIYAERLGQHANLIAHHYAAAEWKFEATRWRRRAALHVTNIELSRRRRPGAR